MSAYLVTYAQYLAGHPYSAADTVALCDSSAVLTAISATDLGALAANGVDIIDATDNVLSLGVAQFTALVASGIGFDPSDQLILADTGAAIGAASAAVLAQLVAAGVTNISPSDAALSLTVAQLGALAGATLDPGAVVTLADTGANLAGLSASVIATLAGLGVDKLDAADDSVALTVDQYLALGALSLSSVDTVTLADAGAAISALTATQIAALKARGIDAINASNDSLTLAVDQYKALGGVTLTSADTVVLADTAVHLASLTAADIAALAGAGVDRLDATDNRVSLTVAKFQALGTVALTAGDVVTLSDTGAHLAALSAGQIGQLAGAGIDVIHATDGALSLTVAKYLALGLVSLTQADTVTLADTGAAIATLTPTQIAALGGAGVDRIDATDDAVSLSVDQVQALGAVTLATGDVVTLNDTSTDIAGLSATDIGQLAGQGVDVIDASDNVLTLSLAKYLALGTVKLAPGDDVTLTDTGANLSGLTPGQIAGLAAAGVDRIHAANGVLALNVAQYKALGGVLLTPADSVSLWDTGANIASLSVVAFSQLAANGVDVVNASDNLLALSVAQYQALGGVALTQADTVTLADSGANLAALTPADIAALAGAGVDRINASDNALSLSLAQFQALGPVTLSAADTVTCADTGSAIAAISAGAMGTWGAAGIDRIDASDNFLALTVAQYLALQPVTFSADDKVVMTDTGKNLQAMSVATIQLAAAKGVDQIDSTSDFLALSLDKLDAMAAGSIALSPQDLVFLRDSAANLEALTPLQIAGYAAQGVDRIDSTTGTLDLTVAQLGAIVASGLHLSLTDQVGIDDTDAHIASLDASQIAKLKSVGVDSLDATDNLLVLRLDQYNALGRTSLSPSDTVVLSDLGSSLAQLTIGQIALAGARGVDVIDATDNRIDLNLKLMGALQAAHITIAPGDVVRMAATSAELEGLSPAQITALSATGLDIINSTDNVLNFNGAQMAAVADAGLSFTPTDLVSLRDTGAQIAALTATEINNLAAAFVDKIDATDDKLDLTAAQYLALHAPLGEIHLAADDGVTLKDTGANLANITIAQFQMLAEKGVDHIDATDNILALSAAQIGGLGSVTLDASDKVILTDGSSAIQSLTPAQLSAYGAAGVDFINATDNLLKLDAAQASALVHTPTVIVPGDTALLVDIGAHIAGLSIPDLSALAAHGFDMIKVSDHALTLTLGQYAALGSVALSSDMNLTINGTSGDDVITGGPSVNILNGGGGSDVLSGGGGADVLSGGGGADSFVFKALTDSLPGHADDITDLTNGDIIDLSAIDADTTTPGIQAFTLTTGFSDVPGQAVLSYDGVSNKTTLSLDVNGDGASDMNVLIDGDHHLFTHFVL